MKKIKNKKCKLYSQQGNHQLSIDIPGLHWLGPKFHRYTRPILVISGSVI